jgi:hypothetical protein
MILFWDSAMLPLQQDGPMLLVQAMLRNEKIDILSPSQGEDVHEHIRQVEQGDTGLMLVKTAALDRMAPPWGEIDLAPLSKVGGDTGITEVNTAQPARVPVFFSEDPTSFAMMCKTAGVRWYEHGAVTCTDAGRETEAALVAV